MTGAFSRCRLFITEKLGTSYSILLGVTSRWVPDAAAALRITDDLKMSSAASINAAVNNEAIIDGMVIDSAETNGIITLGESGTVINSAETNGAEVLGEVTGDNSIPIGSISQEIDQHSEEQFHDVLASSEQGR